MSNNTGRPLQDVTTNATVTRTNAAVAVKSSKPCKTLMTSYFPRLKPDVSQFKSKVSFLDFPRELRDRIYAYAIPGYRSCCEDCKKNGIPNFVATDHPPHLSLDRIEPALSRACRRIREEVLPIFYSETSFAFIIYGWHIICVLKAWRKILKEEYANSIRSLRFTMLTNEGLPNARHFLKTMEESFHPDCRYMFFGDSPRMCSAFQNCCEIGKAARSKGMSWDEVGDVLDRVEHVLSAGGFEGTWMTAEDDGLHAGDHDDDEGLDEDDDDLPDLYDSGSEMSL